MTPPDGYFIVEKKKPRRRGISGSRYAKKSGVFATAAGFTPRGSGNTRASVLKAAEVFRDQARANAAKFSRRIPPATNVTGYLEEQAMVWTDGVAAPNAAPFEFGERHPSNLPNITFNKYGRRTVWAPQGVPPKPKSRPYMSRAVNSKTIDKAADIYAAAEVQLLLDEKGW